MVRLPCRELRSGRCCRPRAVTASESNHDKPSSDTRRRAPEFYQKSAPAIIKRLTAEHFCYILTTNRLMRGFPAAAGNRAHTGVNFMPFVKGQSGNPARRPIGSPNKINREAEAALEAVGGGLVDRIVDHAAAGHRMAAAEISRAFAAGDISIDEAKALTGLAALEADTAIDNNKAESMAPERLAAAPAAPAERPAVVNISENTSAAGDVPAAPWSPLASAGRHGINGATIARLMGSTSPLAHLAGALPQKGVSTARGMPAETRAA
jgi:hypothetical protein